MIYTFGGGGGAINECIYTISLHNKKNHEYEPIF